MAADCRRRSGSPAIGFARREQQRVLGDLGQHAVNAGLVAGRPVSGSPCGGNWRIVAVAVICGPCVRPVWLLCGDEYAHCVHSPAQ